MARSKQSLGDKKKSRAVVASGDKKPKKSLGSVAAVSAKSVPAATVGGGIKKKPYRFRPGTVALREIRKYQKSTDLLMRRAPFYRLVREVAQDFKENVRFEAAALNILQEAAESVLIDLFQDAHLLRRHCDKITVMPADLQLAEHFMAQHSDYSFASETAGAKVHSVTMATLKLPAPESKPIYPAAVVADDNSLDE
jgi:histone H3